MTIKLSSKGGGSGGFAVNSIAYGFVPAGSSGNILFVPATEGSVIKLSYLVSDVASEAGITITCGSREVVTSATIDFGAVQYQGLSASIVIGASLAQGSANLAEISTLPGESLTIAKDTGSTLRALYYTYQIGA